MITSSWQEVESGGSRMRSYLSVPDGSGPFPGVIAIQHQGGVDEFMEQMTQRLAQAGYVAVASDLYHRDGPDCKDDIVTRRSRLRDRTVIDDVNAAASFLQRHESVDASRLGIIGFCMGGRVAYLAAAVSPFFKAAVAYYAGNTFRAWGRDIPSPFERTGEIHCPVLGHFGEEDKNPSPEDMRKLDAELTKFNKPHEFHAYPNAAHAFMDATKESYRRHADEASWPRTLDFFNRQLGASAGAKIAAAR